MKAKEDRVEVVFRQWNDDTIALFPGVMGTNAYDCMSYMHVGQHGAADPVLIMERTRPAKQKEYRALKEELERIGYSLRVIKKFLPRHRLERREGV